MAFVFYDFPFASLLPVAVENPPQAVYPDEASKGENLYMASCGEGTDL